MPNESTPFAAVASTVQPPPALRYQPAEPSKAWPPETKAVVAAAAVVSALSLATWGGSVWMFVQPSAFPRSRLMLAGPFSFDFLRFVLHAVSHAAVIAGALTAARSARSRPRLARRLLLGGACGVLALALYQFGALMIFQTGLSQQRRGPDQIVSVAMDGARLVGMNVICGLLVMMLVLSRSGALPGGAGPAGWPTETGLIIAAAAVVVATDLLSDGALVWISLRPDLFTRIGAPEWTTAGVALFASRIALRLPILAGAAVMLPARGRRAGAPRVLILIGAAGLIALSLYGYVHSMFRPPAGMPRYQGARRIITTVYGVASLVTLATIHALAVFALTRRRTGD